MPSRRMLTIIAAFAALAPPAFAQQRVCVEELAGTCLKWREEAPRATPAAPAAPAAISPDAAAERRLGLDASERRAIQAGLNAEGFDAGAPDGAFGPRTRRAIAAFQRGRGEPATGYLTAEQAVALRGAAASPAPETAAVGVTAPQFTSVSKFSGSIFRVFVNPADAGAMRLRLRVETFDAGEPFDQSCMLSTQGRDECVLEQLQWHNVAVESAYPNVRLLFQPTLRRTNPWGPSVSPGLISVTIE